MRRQQCGLLTGGVCDLNSGGRAFGTDGQTFEPDRTLLRGGEHEVCAVFGQRSGHAGLTGFGVDGFYRTCQCR